MERKDVILWEKQIAVVTLDKVCNLKNSHYTNLTPLYNRHGRFQLL